MTMTPHSLEAELPAEELAMLLVGKNKAGKSLLASTAPGGHTSTNPDECILFLDFDRRLASLAGRKHVYGITFADPTNTALQPTAFNEMLEVLGKLERGERSLKACGFNVPDTLKVKTVVFDSVLTMANAARNYSLYSNPKELAYVVNIGGRQYRCPRNWTGWNSEQAMVEPAIMQARSIKGLNVIAILHEVMEEDPRSTEETPIFTGKVVVYPKRYNTLLTYFNEVWRLTRDVGQFPKVTVSPDGVFTLAATALNITKVDTLDINAIIAQARNGNQKPK